MSTVTICPKELYIPKPISSTNQAVATFEQKVIFPLVCLIENCIENNINIIFSYDLLSAITAKAPWAECSNPDVNKFLNEWYVGIISKLEKYATINTSDAGGSMQCKDLDDESINNHFKNFLGLQDGALPKTILKFNNFGIHVKDACSLDKECSCNLLVPHKHPFKAIKNPWYVIYPTDLPSEGEFAFQPPKEWETLQSPKKCQSGKGYLDENGHSWEWDKLHKNHWDVQHGDGNYTNVSPTGKILGK